MNDTRLPGHGNARGVKNPSTALTDALAYRRAGISVVPTHRNKLPYFKLLPLGDDGKHHWEPFQHRLPSEEEIQDWFRRGAVGYGTIGGTISGNLETLDFDVPDGYPQDTAERTWAEFMAKVHALQPGLVDHLSLSATQSGGRHLRYRCEEPVDGSTKLAEVPALNSSGELIADNHGKVVSSVLIETRGEGGYAVGPGSPGYAHIAGPPAWELATLTGEERNILLQVARSFDRLGGNLAAYQINAEETPRSGRPGDDFNERGDWDPILDALGLRFRSKDQSGVRFYQRIGSEHPIAANLGYGGKDLLRVFSTNLKIPHSTTYSKFAAFTHLHHQGDYSLAAADLRQKGFGTQAEEKEGSGTSNPTFGTFGTAPNQENGKKNAV